MKNQTSEVFEIAIKEFGITEDPIKQNPRIIEYHSATSLKASTDEISWCAAFVNWCLNQKKIKGTGLANARSFLKWGEETTRPTLGDICVFWRGKKDSWQGHVGFYAGETNTHIIVFGGNQDNRVCFKLYPKTNLLSIRHYA